LASPIGNLRTAVVALALCAVCACAVGKPVDLPFDFSRGAIGLDVTVRGTPLYVILDTGVDPSVIDIARARDLALAIDRDKGGEGSGVGGGKAPMAYPTTINGLAIGGAAYSPFSALTSDLGVLSARYGRRLDGVLGYSFIRDKTLLIDYPRQRLIIADDAKETAASLRSCHTRWSMPLTFLGDDNTPVFAAFRFGGASGPATLDTGSNGAVTIFPRALDLAGVRSALTARGAATHTGFRGDERSTTYVFGQPVGFGPFLLPAGQVLTLGKPADGGDTRVANIGNKVFAALKLKILLDYRAGRIGFYGQCDSA